MSSAQSIVDRATPIADGRATRPRVLFVGHSSRLAGAELVLLDVVGGFPGSSVLMLEDGPLLPRLRKSGLHISVSRCAPDMGGLKRDRSLMPALGIAGRMAAVTLEITAIARQHAAIYANSQKAFVLAAPAAALARRPLIWHLHDILVPAHFGRSQMKLVVGLANRFARLVIVPSTAVGSAFVAAGGLAGLLRVVPNGITLPDQPSDLDAVRQELHLGTGFTFGVFSRLSPWKGQHVALQVLAKMSYAHCVIAGAALFGEDAYAASLRQLATGLGVADRVRFLGARDDVPRLMRAMDAVLHPSIDPEPFGRTLVEAMLSRVPVVATSAGTAPEILGNGRFGVLVPPDDAGAVAGALERIRCFPADFKNMTIQAEARAKTKYNAEQMRQTICKLVHGVALAAA